ncbi:MAG: GTPase ObgE [Kiritimatiellae bacterium]|jgi:GTP-binding protein|nr:GTPase ObgE [Kiritimatiellia bacterium]
MKSHKFVDNAVLYTHSGSGGNGCASFRREKFVAKGGPDGGDGGNGGSVIIKADKDESSLIRIYFQPHQHAENGTQGMGRQMYGKNGKDLIVKVPCGTEIWDKDTGEFYKDLVEHGEEWVAAKGGKGGLGNIHWKTSVNQAPRQFTPGEKGVEINLRFKLKIVADVGLVGFPNAGKSSLLTKISDAHPKIGSYPFTTLNPIIGTLIMEDYSRITCADIPGLIEGAHAGHGLGHNFLRHIERSSFLAYVIDMAGVDTREPWVDYKNLCNELHLYKEDLKDRPYMVIANKMDLPEFEENYAKFVKETGETPYKVSSLTGDGVAEVKVAMYETFVKNHK